MSTARWSWKSWSASSASPRSMAGLDIPVLMGGRLNQIPEASNSSLPVDVGAELEEAGALLCRSAAEMGPALVGLIKDPAA